MSVSLTNFKLTSCLPGVNECYTCSYAYTCSFALSRKRYIMAAYRILKEI